MKRTAGRAFLLMTLCLTQPVRAQTPIAKEQEQLSALIKQLQAQQMMIAANQAKIDEKLATLGETIREARIYSSRGGR